MADDIMDAFLLYVDSEDSVREELDKRIRDYKGGEETHNEGCSHSTGKRTWILNHRRRCRVLHRP